MSSGHLPGRSQRRYVDVAEMITRAIASGDLGPGARLPSDREISQQLGVSRPTVREGLLMLELLGLVSIRQGSGTYVTGTLGGLAPNDPRAAESPAQLIEARLALEPSIAGLCAGRHDDSGIQALMDLLDEAEAEAGPDGDPATLVQLGLEFHKQLAVFSANPFLADMCHSLVSVADHPLWMLLNRQAMLTTEARREQVAAHRRILDTIRRHDREAAFESMRVHLEQVSVSIVGVI